MARVGTHKQDFTLGAGRVYAAELRDDGKYEGERYVGDTPGFSISIESETQKLMDSDGPTAVEVSSWATAVTRNGTLTLRDASPENLAWFVGGSVATVTQAATPVTDESVGEGLALVADRVYQIGLSPSNPVGVRGVTGVAVRTASPATTFVLGTDYELDADAGHIRVIPGGNLATKATVLVDYTPVASTRPRVSTGDTVGKRVRLRYVANNSTGKNKDLVAPRALITPNGEMAFKSRDAWQEFGMSIVFETPTGGGSAIYIDGEPVTT